VQKLFLLVTAQLKPDRNIPEGIGQGMEDLKKARVRPARKALEMFRRNHAIPR
jgi:hypothetical protein